MTSAPRQPVSSSHFGLGLKVAGEVLVVLAALFPGALVVWAVDAGITLAVTLGALIAIVLLGLGPLAWFRPLGGGLFLVVFGCAAGFFALSVVALAPDARVALLVASPTIATVASGVCFLIAAANPTHRGPILAHLENN